MKAVRIHEHGGADVIRWEECAEPRPGPGEVAVRVRAASINHLDLWVRAGLPGLAVSFPRILGSDGAGEILECGPGVADLETGTRVLLLPGISSGNAPEDLAGFDNLARDYGILGESCDGVQAEVVVLPRRNLLPFPAELSWERAAAFPLVFCTAWGMLVDKCAVRAGQDVLVLGAGSGVGSSAIQLARAFGARVFTTVGSEEKVERAAALGAERVIDHSREKFDRVVKELTGGRGVDIVVEHVGAATFARSLRSLCKGGKLVTCGATTGPRVELDLAHVFMKHQQVIGSTMGPKSCFPVALKLIAQGRYEPVVDRVLAAKDAAEGHRVLERREHFGKVVLRF